MDATAELNSLTLGTGTAYAIDVDGIGGLGTPEPKVAEASFDGRDGSFSACSTPACLAPAIGGRAIPTSGTRITRRVLQKSYRPSLPKGARGCQA